MKALYAVVLLAASVCARADVASDLKETVIAVERADDMLEQNNLHIDLKNEIATLTSLIDGGALNVAGQSIARYWRARAYSVTNWSRLKKGESADRAIAEASLADFQRVVGNAIEARSWGVTVSNALYAAGTVARNHLEDYPRAYDYWRRCADMGHAGCLNIMASAYLTGSGGMPVNVEKSIELNKKVYGTGTDFQCAGAYSALMIAQTMHFAGMPTQPVDPLDWIHRGYQLLDELSARDKTQNPCERDNFEATEYLLRLSRGERKPELLRAAMGRSRPEFKPIAQYLLGGIERAPFERSLEKIALKYDACWINFLAYWHAQIQGNDALARQHVDRMTAFGGDHCQIELALTRLSRKRRRKGE